jgi:DNA polymerase delta subunit 4
MSPKSVNSSSKRQDSLKQGTLSFATVKRVGSSNATSSKSKSLKSTKPAPTPRSSISVTSTVEDDFDDVELFFSEDEAEEKDEIQDAFDVAEDHKKPTRAQTGAVDKLTTAKKASQVAAATPRASSKASKARPNEVSKTVSADEKPELNVKDRKWNKHYAEVKEKMGYLPPLHAGNQNKIHEILRVFDLSYEFGPCVGIPRLERWERAQSLGLNPPKEVYDILNTKQGSALDEYSQSVFHNQV